MKWSELTTEERDRLMHTKVMGEPIGKCEGIAYYTGRVGEDEWYCDKCKKYYYDIEEDGKHEKPIPHYSTDMNAALSALLHVGRQFVLACNPTAIYKFSCRIEPASNDEWVSIGISDNVIEASNFAVLQACGVEIEQ